jgi:hypothetical protein
VEAIFRRQSCRQYVGLVLRKVAFLSLAEIVADTARLLNMRKDTAGIEANAKGAFQRKMAQRTFWKTRFEPFILKLWCGWQESNPRPLGS